MQQLGINLYGWYWARRRLGRVFELTWRAYVERESWSPDRFQDFVEQQLRAQVQRAYREIPYYRHAFLEYGITEELLGRFRLEDLPKLPLLEKSTVRADPTVLLTERAAKSPLKAFNTSGTTGTPIRVYWDSATHQHNIAAREARSFRWAGVSIRDPRAVVAGRVIVPRKSDRPPFWRYNRWERQLYLSAFHISPTNVPHYVAALNEYRPLTLEGWPSAIYFLARLIRESDLEVHGPRAIITTSERLEPHMREAIESVFGTKVYEEYSAVENCALATECDMGHFHIHPDFGYVEILRPDGQPAHAGEAGEAVATGFANVNQVFLRYRTGDLATRAPTPCQCGRDLFPTLSELVGRVEDALLLPGGREITRFDFLFKELSGIYEGQVIQEAVDHFVINIVPAPGYSRVDAETIRKRMVSRYNLGPEITIDVREIDAIPRGPNGKFRAVINRVERNRTPDAPEDLLKK
jgi:phenylacetate-CoA ligase